MPLIDVATVLVVLAGLGLAVALAILVGTATARVFFAASRQHREPPPAAGAKND